jgi:hypothetical protein
MPSGSNAKPVGTLSLAGSYIPSGEKKRGLDEVFSGNNIRSTLDGGRHDRPGYEDTEIDLSSYNLTAARGFFGAEYLKRLWIAGDDDTNVNLLFANPVDDTVIDTGVNLATGYNVFFCEVEMDIFYGNGQDVMGRIVVGELNAAVSSGGGTVTLKAGHTSRFPAAASGRIGNDTFSWTGKTATTLTGCTGITDDHVADEVVTYATTLTPTYVTAPTVIAEWYASLNIGGYSGAPRAWEYSRTATAANPERYYDFSVATNNELVGRGSSITGMLPTNDYFYLFKEDGIWAVSRTGVSSGARPPLPFASHYGISNPWCVCDMEGVAAFLTTGGRLLPITVITENNGQKLSLDAQFDRRVRSYLRTIDKDTTALAKRWTFYNPEDQLLKVGVTVDGVREILVYDAQLGIYYPPDTNKDFDFMAALNGNSYGYSSDGQKIYLDEVGRFDDTVPVDGEWKTGRFGGEFTRSAFRYLYAHGRMTEGSKKTFTIFINGEEKYSKELTDAYMKTASESRPVGYAGVGTAGLSYGASLDAQEFQFPIGAFSHGQDIQLKCSGGSEDGGDFVQVDGFAFGVTPRSKVPLTHV